MGKMMRIEELDIMRGIAAVLMILGHSFIVYPVDISNVPWCHALQYWIYTFHMEAFFFIAGFVFQYNDYWTFIKKKARRVLVPYAFFGGFALLFRSFGGGMVNGTESFKEGIKSLIFHGGGYWFIYVLFIIVCIYPFIDKYIQNVWILVMLSALFILIGSFISVTDIFLMNSICFYLPYFMAGHAVRLMFSKKKVHNAIQTDSSRILMMIASVLLYILMTFLQRNSIAGERLFRFGQAACMIFVLYAVAACITSHKKICAMPWVNFLKECSRYSLQLYLMNGYLLTILRFFICRILHIEEPVLIVIGILAGDILITLFLCKFVIARFTICRNLCGV